MAPPQPCSMRHATSKMDVARYAAEKRSEREQPDRRRKHAPRSKPVRHPPADRNENRQAQRVARQHGLHAERRHLQRLGNGRHRRIQNRRVQRLHKKRYGHEPRQAAACSKRMARQVLKAVFAGSTGVLAMNETTTLLTNPNLCSLQGGTDFSLSCSPVLAPALKPLPRRFTCLANNHLYKTSAPALSLPAFLATIKRP